MEGKPSGSGMMSAELNELESMISNFRVAELQALLAYAKMNKSGRKLQLQRRAVELLRQNPTAVKRKIQELHRQRYSSTDYGPIPKFKFKGHPGLNEIPAFSASTNNIDSAGIRNLRSRPLTFRNSPFFEVDAELVKPGFLVSNNNGKSTEFLTFRLRPEQAHYLSVSRNNGKDLEQKKNLTSVPDAALGTEVHNTNAWKNDDALSQLADVRLPDKDDFRIHLRFCLLEAIDRKDDNLPCSLVVQVNGISIQIPSSTIPSRPGLEPRRKNQPIEITTWCKLSPTVMNRIAISWMPEADKTYAFVVYLVNHLTSAELLHRISQKEKISATVTRNSIQNKLKADADDEIATTSIHAPLTCPLSKKRIQVPCRASTCNHLQCFDGLFFLEMNQKRDIWNCPTCFQPIIFQNIFVDALFTEILSEAPRDCLDVQFAEDGSWTPVKNVPTSMSKQTSVHIDAVPSITPSKTVEVIDLTIDDDEDVSCFTNTRPYLQQPRTPGGQRPAKIAVLCSQPRSFTPKTYSSSTLPVPYATATSQNTTHIVSKSAVHTQYPCPVNSSVHTPAHSQSLSHMKSTVHVPRDRCHADFNRGRMINSSSLSSPSAQSFSRISQNPVNMTTTPAYAHPSIVSQSPSSHGCFNHGSMQNNPSANHFSLFRRSKDVPVLPCNFQYYTQAMQFVHPPTPYPGVYPVYEQESFIPQLQQGQNEASFSARGSPEIIHLE